MNIAIIGYGKMGKEIEKIAILRGHKITLIIDRDNTSELNTNNLKSVDVAIEFTHPENAFQNILACFAGNVPVVCGTTGWLQDMKKIKHKCTEKEQGFFYASNFSIGVNIFFAVNKYLAKLMDKYKEYDVTISEIHHTQKKDAPSGTAITLAEGIMSNLSRKTNWKSESIDDNEDLMIASTREGDVPGTHIVQYASTIDDILIKHEAHSRKGFALGAVLASEWIKGKKGIFTMEDMLGL